MKKLNCEEARQLLDAFHDNEIDSVTSLRVEEHVVSCQRCRDEEWWSEEVRASLGRIKGKTPPPSAALRERVAAIPAAGGNARSKPRRRTRPVILQAAAVLVIGLLLSVFMLPQAAYSGMDARLFVRNHKEIQTSGEASLELRTEDPTEAANWLRAHLADVDPPGRVPEGYRLRGALITEIDGARTGLLLYEGNGRSISCFVRAGGEPVERGFDVVEFEADGIKAGRCRGHQIVTWESEQGPVVLVGDLSEETLLAFAMENS